MGVPECTQVWKHLYVHAYICKHTFMHIHRRKGRKSKQVSMPQDSPQSASNPDKRSARSGHEADQGATVAGAPALPRPEANKSRKKLIPLLCQPQEYCSWQWAPLSSVTDLGGEGN